MKKLIERARAVPMQARRRHTVKFSKEETEELALAWLQGEIGYTQASEALGAAGSATYSIIATAIKRAFDKGQVKLK